MGHIFSLLPLGTGRCLAHGNVSGQISALSVSVSETVCAGDVPCGSPFHSAVPPLDLNLILSLLHKPTFEPINDICFSAFIYKVGSLVPITSAWQVSELAALSCIGIEWCSDTELPSRDLPNLI